MRKIFTLTKHSDINSLCSREQIWIQHRSTGDLAIINIETKEPSETFKVLATSIDQYAIKFPELLERAHGVDFTKPPPPLNEKVENWREK